MPNKNPRLYKGKDVDMLTVLSTILINAEVNQSALQKKRTNLTTAYLGDLENRLNSTIKKNLGIDNAKQLRQQTATVYSIEAPAYAALSEMKAQIESTFSDNSSRETEVLKELGYADDFKEAQNNDTEALISLLYKYQTNMTPALQEELVAGGTPVDSITAPTAYAETLRAANVSQESFKSTKKVATATVIQSYNDIYKEVMDKISKLARIFFPDNLAQQQLFSYTGLLKAVNNKTGQEATTVQSPS